MNKLKQVIVSAAAALSVLAPGCSNVQQYVATQEQCKKEEALEDLVRSVYCIRNASTYTSPDKARTEESEKFGTGFAYKREEGWTYIVTNHHVGSSPDQQVVFDFFNPENNGTWQKKSESVSIVDSRADQNKEDDIAVEVVRSDELLDTMVLRTRAPLHIAKSYHVAHQQVNYGDQVYVAGYPLGITRAVTEGTIAKPIFLNNSVEYLFLDITVQPGHSGSPVFLRDTDGEFYLLGQIRMCLPYTGMCGGFAMASNISELADVWKISTPETPAFLQKLIPPKSNDSNQQNDKNAAQAHTPT